jgi:hypothetical protein
MQKERVTLEVTHDEDEPASQWVPFVIDTANRRVESVVVVVREGFLKPEEFLTLLRAEEMVCDRKLAADSRGDAADSLDCRLTADCIAGILARDAAEKQPAAGERPRDDVGGSSSPLELSPSRSAPGVTDGGAAPAAGPRVERVVLEIVHYGKDDADKACYWDWQANLDDLGYVNSVRVVTETEETVSIPFPPPCRGSRLFEVPKPVAEEIEDLRRRLAEATRKAEEWQQAAHSASELLRMPRPTLETKI